MITDALVGILTSVVTAILGLIPTVSFDWGGATGLGELVTTANIFFPIQEAFALIRTVISWGAGLAVAWAVYKLIDWMPFT